MPEIHPTAILDGNISLADDVIIGPYCVLNGDITIGKGTTLIGNTYLTGKLTIGENNTIYPFASIGFAPQDINFPADLYEPGIVIGNDNIFREHSTVHRATQDTPTTSGHGNVFMTTSHVAHDCQIANNCTIVTDVSLAGHVHLQDNVILGGSSNIHQFVTLGKGVMIIGLSYASYDVPPYFMITGGNIIGSINIIGMRRSGMERSEITRRKEIYKLLYKSENSIKSSVAQLKDEGDKVALEYVAFIESSRRGVVAPYHHKRSERRGMATAHE
jgi:UDP-N-acetylglucosamine acyltransferase